MKTLRIFSALFFLFVLAGAAAFFYAPRYVESKIEAELASRGFQVEAEVFDLNRKGLSLSLKALEPYEVLAPQLRVTWDLSDWRNQVGVNIEPVAEAMSLKNKSFGLRASQFRVKGYYNWAVFVVDEARADLELDAPLKAKLKIQSYKIGIENSFLYEVEVAPQDFSKILSQPSGLKTQKPFKAKGRLDLKGDKQFLQLSSLSPLIGETMLLEEKLSFSIDKIDSQLELNGKGEVHVVSMNAGLDFNFDSLPIKGKLKLSDFVWKKKGKANLNLDLNWKKNSLKKFFASRSWDFAKEIVGSSSIKSDLTLKGSDLKIDSSLSLKIKSMILYAIPTSGLDLKTQWTCTYNNLEKLDCKPLSGTHLLAAASAGEAFPFKDLKFQATLKGEELAGDLTALWLDSKIKSIQMKGRVDGDWPMESQLNIAGLDTSKLFAVIGMKSLQGRGKMRGDLFLKYDRKNGLIMPPSKLRSEAKGVIRYKDPSTLDVPRHIDTLKEFNSLLARGQQVLVYKALDNFHYSTLVVEARRPKAGALAFKFHLVGSNPDLANGQIFDITVPIEGNLEGLLIESSFRTLAESESSEEYIKRLRKLIRK